MLAEHEVVCDVTHKTSPIGGHVLLTIDSGWYLKDVVDPTFVQNQACWLGSWWLALGGSVPR